MARIPCRCRAITAKAGRLTLAVLARLKPCPFTVTSHIRLGIYKLPETCLSSPPRDRSTTQTSPRICLESGQFQLELVLIVRLQSFSALFLESPPLPALSWFGFETFLELHVGSAAGSLRHPISHLSRSQLPANIFRRSLLSHCLQNRSFDFLSLARQAQMRQHHRRG